MPIIEIKVTDEAGKVLKEEEISLKPQVTEEAVKGSTEKVKATNDNSKGSEEGKSNRRSTSKSKKS